MVPILISSTTGYAGRTFIGLGLAMKLIEQGYRVGYIKPLGKTPVKKGKDIFDATALFAKETLGLDEPMEVISPFVQTYENLTLLFQGQIRDVDKQVRAAYGTLKNKDFVIIGGSGDFFDGALLGLDTISLAASLRARVLVVEAWRGDISAEALYGARTLLGARFLGGILNKVPLAMMDHIKTTVRPFLEQKEVSVFGVFPKDRFLESVSVAELNELLNGKVLCCNDRLQEFVENFLIGAMDVDSALTYFRRTPNKVVITGAHRSDIQLAALETSTKCIILTGGLETNEVVLGKAQTRGVPILSVPDDTFSAISKIELRMGKSSILDGKKMGRARELISAGFDMYGFLKKLGKV
jgi:BioD-like phosphotransacetylase family protein